MKAEHDVYEELDALRGSGDPRITRLKCEAEEYIVKISKLRLKRAMQMRYIDDMTWDAIADAEAEIRAETSDAPRKRVKRYINTLV